MSYENLMRPIRIQNMTLRNRVMMAPMGTNLANPDGSISEEHKNYYQLRAKGGTGLIVVENACVAFPLGSNGTTQLRLDHDSFIPHMYELTEKVHAWGCKISIQVNHAGSAAIPSRIGQQPVSAGDIPCKTDGVIPRALSTEEVYALVGKYADACKRAQMAGFDAVEIHAGHSYLVSQFISPTTNNRTDEFGGSAENRARFLKCILQETRKRLGRNFPIAIRISADELVPGGNTLEDTLGWLPYVDEYVDLYDVSAGLNDSIEKMIDKADLPDGWKRYLSKAVKEKTGKPVVISGNIRDPHIAEDIIASGDSMLGLLDDLKKRNAGRIFIAATFCFFTNGTQAFEEVYRSGKLAGVMGTNLTYLPDEVRKAPWFIEVDMSKYMAYIIATLNHDHSLDALLNPMGRIVNLLERYNRGEKI